MHKISKATIIRTIVLLVMLANQVLALFGHSPLPFSDDQVQQGVSTVLTVLASIWTWWKNNSFTTLAIRADHYKKSIADQDEVAKRAVKQNTSYVSSLDNPVNQPRNHKKDKK